MLRLARRSFSLISLSLVLAAGVPACASSVLHAEDYDQSCAAASDCISVPVGDLCACGACENAGIAKSAEATFQADLSAASVTCNSDITCVACPESPAPTCVAGKCVVSN